MARSKILKPKTSHRSKSKYSTNINCLPQELLIDAIARVASSSTTDLFNLKITSKFLSTMSENGFVLEHALIKDKLPRDITRIRSHAAKRFLELCKLNGNPEALFREGMLEFFNASMNKELGPKKIKKAAKKGHEEASYLYGMILLSSKESSHLGIEVLNNLLRRFDTKGITKCRVDIKDFLDDLWVEKLVKPEGCDHHEKPFDDVGKLWKCGGVRLGTRDGWISNDRHDFVGDGASCDFCMWKHEANVFYDILRRSFHGAIQRP